MMPSRSADTLFQLIHSLQKSEKRNFKLYVKRNSSNEDLKIIQLFDALDRMSHYDEAILLEKAGSIRKDQLSNRKAHLYKQILASLRLLESDGNIDLQLHELLDYARILYNKGLYHQSLRTLDKARELAKEHNQNSFLVQVLFFEKKIESLHITRSLKGRARELSSEAETVADDLALLTRLSNLALELYGWYIEHGHARNEAEDQALTAFFSGNLPAGAYAATGFYQQLYLFQGYCWYAFIRQDFLQYYRYTKKWVNLFHANPVMIEVETAHYIKGLHNLSSAHFDLGNHPGFLETLEVFERFAESEIVGQHQNNRVQVFVYLYTARINRHFMEGTFREGLMLVPRLKEQLEEHALYLDRHRVLVFYYKIASMYFGAGDYDNAVVYLSRIINWKTDLRNDLQSYARLLHLIAHFELGNMELLEYLIKSVYRFMAKMQNLSEVEEEVFLFLRKSFYMTPENIRAEFVLLLDKLKSFEKARVATRAFSYLDIISWLESKVDGKRVQDVIRRKFLEKQSRVVRTS